MFALGKMRELDFPAASAASGDQAVSSIERFSYQPASFNKYMPSDLPSLPALLTVETLNDMYR